MGRHMARGGQAVAWVSHGWWDVGSLWNWEMVEVVRASLMMGKWQWVKVDSGRWWASSGKEAEEGWQLG